MLGHMSSQQIFVHFLWRAADAAAQCSMDCHGQLMDRSSHLHHMNVTQPQLYANEGVEARPVQ